MDNLKLENRTLKKEIEALKKLCATIKLEKRGRPQKFKEPLSEHMNFLCTKSQSIKLEKFLEEKGVSLSSYIRGLIFGEE